MKVNPQLLTTKDDCAYKDAVKVLERANNRLSIACAYWYAKALSDYGINIAARWETITQQKAALDSAYVQGRNDEAKLFNNVDVRPAVRGKWQKIGQLGVVVVCSVCGKSPDRKTNFCPNCGARMEES